MGSYDLLTLSRLSLSLRSDVKRAKGRTRQRTAENTRTALKNLHHRWVHEATRVPPPCRAVWGHTQPTRHLVTWLQREANRLDKWVARQTEWLYTPNPPRRSGEEPPPTFPSLGGKKDFTSPRVATRPKHRGLMLRLAVALPWARYAGCTVIHTDGESPSIAPVVRP